MSIKIDKTTKGIVLDGVFHESKDGVSCKECSLKDTLFCRNFGKICIFFGNKGFVRKDLTKQKQ